MVISQAGMFLVYKMGSAYRPVTIKSCAFVMLVSVCTLFLICVLWELYGRKGHIAMAIAFFFALVTADSLIFPLCEGYYTYSTIAPIAALEIPAVILIFGKHESRKKLQIEKCSLTEKVFVAVALVCGIIVCYFTPYGSYNCWDDESHYMEANAFSQNLYPTYSESEIKLIYCEIQGQDFDEREEFIDYIQSFEDYEKGTIIEDPKSIIPIRIGTLPFTLAIWIGRLINLNLYPTYMLGRALNYLVYMALMFAAIRKIRRGKILMFVISLMPTMLFMAGNCSYDQWVFAFFSLSFAYYFNALESSEPMSIRDNVIMIGAMILAVLPKLPYLCLFSVLLFIPKDKFQSQKHRKYHITAVILSAAAAFAYLYFMSFILAGDPADDRTGSGQISTLGQIQYILSDIPSYISLLISSLKDYWKLSNAYQYITSFGYMGQTGGSIIYLLLAAAAAINCAPRAKISTRIIGVVIFAAMCAVLETLFYMVFTPMGADYISGCQLRYMYPMLIPFFVFVFGGWIRPDNKYADALIVSAASVTTLYILTSFLVLPYFA